MALINSPFGAIPSTTYNQSMGDFALNTFAIANTEATSVNRGDLVVRTPGLSSNNTPIATRATPGTNNPITGAVIGLSLVGLTVDSPYNVPALTGGAVNVDVDKDQVYIMQANGTVTASQIGLQANFTTGISTPAGVSNIVLNTASIGTGNQMTILGIAELNPDSSTNSITDPFPILLVKFNLFA